MAEKLRPEYVTSTIVLCFRPIKDDGHQIRRGGSPIFRRSTVSHDAVCRPIGVCVRLLSSGPIRGLST